MTDQEKVDAMAQQFLAAADTETIRRLLTATTNSVLLHRITGAEQYEDLATKLSADAVAEVADREFADLPADERDQVADVACTYVRNALTQAVMHTWTTCTTLQADPLTIPADVIALTAAMYAIPPKPTAAA